MSLDGSGGRMNSGDGGMRSMGGQQQQQRGPGNFYDIINTYYNNKRVIMFTSFQFAVYWIYKLLILSI